MPVARKLMGDLLFTCLVYKIHFNGLALYDLEFFISLKNGKVTLKGRKGVGCQQDGKSKFSINLYFRELCVNCPLLRGFKQQALMGNDSYREEEGFKPLPSGSLVFGFPSRYMNWKHPMQMAEERTKQRISVWWQVAPSRVMARKQAPLEPWWQFQEVNHYNKLGHYQM